MVGINLKIRRDGGENLYLDLKLEKYLVEISIAPGYLGKQAEGE